MKTTMRIGELFAGVSGFGLGFERAGHEIVFQVEIDKDCQNVNALHHPDAVRLYDVCAVHGVDLPPCDVLVFGSPCQDMSVAGKRSGLKGERSGLFYEAIRIIRELRERDGSPRYVVWENVPGALSSNNGLDFIAVVRAFRECGAMDIAWRVLDARYFGVAQRRRRVFVVCDFAGYRAEEILFERDSLRRDSETCGTEGQEPAGAVGDGVAIGLDEEVNGCVDGIGTLKAHKSGGSQLAALVPDGPYWDGGDVSDTLDVSALVKGQTMPEKRREPALCVEPEATAYGISCESSVGIDVAPTVSRPDSGNHAQAVAYDARGNGDGETATCTGDHNNRVTDYTTVVFDLQQITSKVNRNRVEPGLPCPTLHQAGGVHVCNTMLVRRLTPTECERLMGWPDGWTSVGADGKVMSDSTRYRMCGNGVVANVAEWIAQRM